MALLGRVAGLSIRPDAAAAPRALDRLDLVTGVGAAGDRHADPRSPRQLLLADSGAYADFALAPQALRENLLLDADADVSALASGTVLQVGSRALVRIMFVCEACGQLDRHGARLAARIGARRGMLARVLRGGEVHTGDPVRSLGAPLGAWPADWRERLLRVLEAAPQGSVVAYARLAHLAGIQTSYCRAFRRVLEHRDPRLAARAVSAGAATAAPRWDGAGLFDPAPAELAALAALMAQDTLTSAR